MEIAKIIWLWLIGLGLGRGRGLCPPPPPLYFPYKVKFFGKPEGQTGGKERFRTTSRCSSGGRRRVFGRWREGVPRSFRLADMLVIVMLLWRGFPGDPWLGRSTGHAVQPFSPGAKE